MAKGCGRKQEVMKQLLTIAQLTVNYVTLSQIAKHLSLTPSQAAYVIELAPQLFVKLCITRKGERCIYVTRRFWDAAMAEFPAFLGHLGRRVFKIQSIYKALCNGARVGMSVSTYIILDSLARQYAVPFGLPGIYYLPKMPPAGEFASLKALCHVDKAYKPTKLSQGRFDV